MDPLLIASILSSIGAGTLASIITKFVRRAGEPTKAEVKQAEDLASQAWNQADYPDVLEPGPIKTPSVTGEEEALKILRAYVTDLRFEAARIAKRAGAEHPSAPHIRLAADRIGILRNRASALADIGLALGSILIGGAAAFVINLATGGRAAPGVLPWALAAGGAGLVIFAVSATTKWTNR